MGIPTFIIGILPTYKSIGFLAPLIIVVCRLMQGMCTGGEYNGAAIFSIEHNRGRKKGLIGGIITSSCVFGALMATGLGTLSMKFLSSDLSWRLLFFFGTGISLVGFFIRKSIQESPEFSKPVENKGYFLHLGTTIRENSLAFVIAILSGGLNGVLSYTLFGFLTVYLNRYHAIPLEIAMFSNIFGLLAFMISSPIAGSVLDKLGGKKYFLISILLVIGGANFIFSNFGQNTLWGLIFLQISYGILVGMIAGPQHGFLQDLFPSKNRYAGVSFGFCLGMGVIGGFTPFTLIYLIKTTGNLLMPSFVVSIIALITLFSIMFLRQRETLSRLKAA